MRPLAVPRTSYFVATAGQPRVRRPRDIFTATIGLLLVVWAMIAIDQPPSWEQSFTALVQSSPPWLQTLLESAYSLSLIYSLVLLGALLFGGRERRTALRDVTIVAVGAAALVVFLSLLINDAWPYVLPEIDLEAPVPRFPVMRVALVTAILIVASPYVTRPLRRFGWLAIITTALASISLGYAAPSHTIGSFGIGLLSAGLLLAVAGSPRGYPNPEMVAAALTHLGVPNRDIKAAQYQTWGVVRFVATDSEGELVEVKVHGRDAFDSQLAAKVWHTLWYRETGPAVSYSRLQAVEHEALMTVVAHGAGVNVPRLAAVGAASSDLALISFRDSGVAIADLDPASLSDDLLVQAWSQVTLLHDRSMSHGSLRTSAVHVGRNGAVITDLAFGSVAADGADQGERHRRASLQPDRLGRRGESGSQRPPRPRTATDWSPPSPTCNWRR